MSPSSWRATGWVSHRELERGCRGCIFNAGSFLQWPATTFVRGGGGGLWREEVVAADRRFNERYSPGKAVRANRGPAEREEPAGELVPGALQRRLAGGARLLISSMAVCNMASRRLLARGNLNSR